MSFLKRLNKEIQMYEKDNFILPNLILKPSDNLNVWYFIVYDLKETEYENGVYLGEINIPDRYPFAPPDFKFLSINGRFEINKKLCTSFTGYHKDLYSASWTLSSMCCGLISFMLDDTSKPESKGIAGIFNTTKDDKLKIAKESCNNMKRNKNLFEICEKYFKEYYDILGLN